MHVTDPRLWLAIAAASAPSLLAYNVAPSPTFLNQALAFALWGAFVALGSPARGGRATWPLLGALGLLVLAAGWSWGPGALPASLALSIMGTLLATLVMAAAGAGSAGRDDATDLFAAFCWGWVAAGAINVALALVQVFAPGWADGDWIARSGIPGRAVGNLRQPNHLSSLLLWGCVALATLMQLRRVAQWLAGALFAAFIFAVVLTASRTGLVSVLLLALWGVVDRKLARRVRAWLLAAPLFYAAAWWGMAQWAAAAAQRFGGTERLAEGVASDSRAAIWRNTLDLIAAQPWRGVGLGEFNLAWTLTPFPDRPVAFFDHTHNLPLQLAVELGLPLAGAVIALLLWALVRGLRRALAATGALGSAQRGAMVMVLMIGLHSLLEYPLWYAYFLLPAAWAWGFALGGHAARGMPAARSAVLPWAGVAIAMGAALAVFDYARVAAIFTVQEGGASLEQRIQAGQRSVLFAHHADYAALTSGSAVPASEQDFSRASHYLLDARLMMAWARALEARGATDKARALAQRLREFRKPDAAEFFAACPVAQGASAASTAPPPQCRPPVVTPGWRDYLTP